MSTDELISKVQGTEVQGTGVDFFPGIIRLRYLLISRHRLERGLDGMGNKRPRRRRAV